MRYGWIWAVIFGLAGALGAGCSYTIDKSLACENEPYAAEGYGQECEGDEQCDKKGKAAKVCFNEEYLGLDQLLDSDMLPDGGISMDSPIGASSIVTQLMDMIEPMLGKCTKGEGCLKTGCALCYMCCDCKFDLSQLLASAGGLPSDLGDLGDLGDEKVGFTACVTSDIGEQMSMLCKCGDALTQSQQ